MTNYLAPLPELELNAFDDPRKLPAIRSRFYIPRLEDKPQNPIIQSIQNLSSVLPKELLVLSEDLRQDSGDVIIDQRSCEEENVWEYAVNLVPEYKNRIASWDTLRKTYRKPAAPSPFLTEQAPHIVTAARYQAYPRLSRPNEKLIYLSAEEMLESLNSTLTGCSSTLHTWDAQVERFVPAHGEGEFVQIIMDGMDEVVSDSYMRRFMTIGTLLRRIDIYVLSLRRIAHSTNSTVYGLAHALSSVLVWIREEMAAISAAVGSNGPGRIADFWISFQRAENLLSAVASLCLRDIHLDPDSYDSIPIEPQKILSHVYGKLNSFIESQAPKDVVSVLSFVLTVTSRPYFQSLAQSIGFEGLEKTVNNARQMALRNHSDVAAGLFGDDDDDEVIDDLNLDFDDVEKEGSEEFPIFMSDELREAVVRARRSIRILSESEVDEKLTLLMTHTPRLEWVWTDSEVVAIALDTGVGEAKCPETYVQAAINPMAPMPHPTNAKYKPELAQLALFDMEPGTLVAGTIASKVSSHSQAVAAFLQSFPSSLPLLTPTLPLLTTLIFSPVIKQSDSVSNAALKIFMDSSSPLHFRAHLILLRSYLLLTAHAFKSRLSSALFSDTDEHEADTYSVAARSRDNRGRPQSKSSPVEKQAAEPWAVGLAFGLIDREQWPPGGSDLSFYLRRVIMDSIEHVRAAEVVPQLVDVEDQQRRDVSELGNDEFWDEAEGRLGFAIRDLPIGTGRDKWLDPTCIEALDFLYMDYKPPKPLRCLITVDILSKYQRVFAFLLRLLRIENVMRLLYRIGRTSAPFQSHPAAQKTLVHFRFAGQSFVSSLSSYVYDTAIGGNFDAFLARLAAAESSPGLSSQGYFSDVFSLMKLHSKVLDDILAACLLRSAQRAVGDILRSCLEILLEFGVLVGNVSKGHEKEDLAAVRLEELYSKFQGKMNVLTKALKRASERDVTNPMYAATSVARDKQFPIAPGGMEALACLSSRLSDAVNRGGR